MATTLEITRRSKLMDVLKAYPFLEEQIIASAPPFKNLRNPVLRRTVGQLATIESVAQIGGLDVVELVNTLRRAAGLAELSASPSAPPTAGFAPGAGEPDWVRGEPGFVVDGTALLHAGEVPLEHVNRLLADLPVGGYLLLLTDFEPTPILDAMRKQGRAVHHRGEGVEHRTYIGG